MVARPETPFQRAVLETLRDLPRGEVVSYGFVAEEAGFPGRARAVGTFLAHHDDPPNWWRVVAANGELRAPRAVLQARLLAAEGVGVVDGRCSPSPRTPGTSTPQPDDSGNRGSARHSDV